MPVEALPFPRILAVCGKGGVGKTSISALITKILMKRSEKRILAIDADPAAGLATALGMTIDRTIDDIRKSIIDAVRTDPPGNEQETLARIDYEVWNAVTEKENMAFLAIGRPEEAGCYCRVNSLLKEIIYSMAGHFDYVIIDGEAGLEQINRRVMAKVSHLLMVSDGSLKGRHVVDTIQKVAKSVIGYEKKGIIINKIRGPKEWSQIPVPNHCLGWLTESDALRRLDREGKSLFDLDDADVLGPLENCLEKLCFI